jgi:hypothetical protein
MDLLFFVCRKKHKYTPNKLDLRKTCKQYAKTKPDLLDLEYNDGNSFCYRDLPSFLSMFINGAA